MKAQVCIGLTVWLVGCSSNTEPCAQAPLIPQYGSPAFPAQTAVPPAAAEPVVDKTYYRKLVVLPLEDDDLFRQERDSVRKKLHAAVSRVARDKFEVLSLAAVDTEVTRISRVSKKRCAYEHASLRERAEDLGYLSVTTTVVSSIDGKKGAELWVEAQHRHGDSFTWKGPWDYKLSLLERYDTAFAKLERDDAGGVLGILGSASSRVQDASHGVSFCESGPFQCSPETSAWTDISAPMAECFGGRASSRIGLLLEPGAAPRCEIDDLDSPSETSAALETCVCKAVTGSARMKRLPKRTSLDIEYEAKEIAGKPRPFLAVVDATSNLRTDEESFAESSTVRRTSLSLDGLKDIAPALARCAPAKQTVLVEVELEDTGKVSKAKVASGAAGGAAACIEKQVSAGGFDCTEDGKPATFQLAIRWPSPGAKPSP